MIAVCNYYGTGSPALGCIYKLAVIFGFFPQSLHWCRGGVDNCNHPVGDNCIPKTYIQQLASTAHILFTS